MSSTDPLPRAPAAPNRRLRDTLVLGGLFLLVIGGLAGLAAATGWQETLAQIAKLHLWQIAALLGLSLVNYLMRGLRWHIFARRLGLGTRLPVNILHFLGGFAMSATPGRVGELVRMRWITRESGRSFERVAPLALVDRASDMAAMGILLGLALALSPTGIAFGLPVVALALTGAVIATRPKLLGAIAAAGYRLTGRFPRGFAKIRRAGDTLGEFSNPWLMALAVALGFVGWFAEAWAFHLLLAWMGAEIGVAKAVAIFVFSGLAGGLTGAPGGVGGAEAAMVALLSLEGVGLDASVPATAIIRVTTLWFAIGLGLMVFPLAEKHSKRHRHAMETD